MVDDCDCWSVGNTYGIQGTASLALLSFYFFAQFCFVMLCFYHLHFEVNLL